MKIIKYDVENLKKAGGTVLNANNINLKFMNTNSSTGSKLSSNVGKTERIASILAGTIMIYQGMRNNKSDKFKKFKIPVAIAGGYLLYRGATGHCDLYSVAGKGKIPDTVKNINILTVIHVNKPRTEVYNYWRILSNLPKFMTHLESVDVLDETHSHWKAKAMGVLPAIEWDAEIVKEIDGELLGWNSLPGATIHNAGKVEFRDHESGGTELKVLITYRAPFGDIGESIASFFNPMFEKMIKEDVMSFKKHIETGDY